MLKWYIIAAVLAFAGYQWHLRQQNPVEITNPVYAEHRLDLTVGSRTLNVVLFGKMANQRECEAKAEEFWKKALADCEICQFKSTTCQAELPKRYAGIFDDVPLKTSYLSFTRGDRNERDGRMVLWGLTDNEAEQVCEMMRKGVARHYSGETSCVIGGG